MARVLEGGLAAATVLVSFGVLIGKISPLQLLIMGLIETILFVANAHFGYSILGTVDVGKNCIFFLTFVLIGGSIFIHAFGAYFGLAISLLMSRKDFDVTGDKQDTTPTTDLFSFLGTNLSSPFSSSPSSCCPGSILLWLYWPSFNALLATADARHR